VSCLEDEAHPYDAPALAALFVRCWRSSYRGVVADDVLDALDERRIERWWRHVLEPRPGHRVLVTRDDGVPVAVARVGPDENDPGRGHLFSLYVDPPRARAGLGRTLLQRATSELAAAGFDRATLWVFAANARAIRFYRAAGWRIDDATRVEPEWGALERRMSTTLRR
jgi:ribosomal protein S18 acetylase RimI-like enzyme